MIWTWRRWFRISLLAAIVVGIALVPVWYGYRSSTENTIFVTAGRDDEYVYLGWARQAKQGDWLFDNPYTLEGHAKAYVNPLFFVIGKAAAVTDLPISLVFHIGRVVAGVSLVVAVALFLSYIIRSFRWLSVSLFIVFFAGGIGYLSDPERISFETMTNLFWASRSITEARSIPSILLYPQAPVSVLLLLGIFKLYIHQIERFRWARFGLTTLVSSLLIAVHPYDVVLIVLISFGVLLLRMPFTFRKSVAWASIVLGALPVTLYFFLLSRSDPVYHAWTQVSQSSPGISRWLILFAPLMPLVVAGLIAWRRLELPPWLEKRRGEVLFIWLVLLPVLIYLPVAFQRRLSEGAYLPIGVFATLGIWYLMRRFGKKGLLLSVILVVFSLPDYPFQVLIRTRILKQDYTGGYFLSKSKIAGFQWLERYGDHGVKVMAFPPDGLYIPAFTSSRVYLGHWANTVDSAEKYTYITKIFSPNTSACARLKFYNTFDIEYLVTSKEYAIGQPETGYYIPVGEGFSAVYESRDTLILYRGFVSEPLQDEYRAQYYPGCDGNIDAPAQ